MAYDITQLQADLEPKLHDLSLDKISGNLYDKVYEAGRNILNKIDPKETMRVVPITNAIYDNVFSYVCPSDLKDNKIVTIRPQTNNYPGNNFHQTNIKEFDLYKDNNSFTVEYDDTVKTIKLSKALTQGQLVNSFDSLTANGTWAASAVATNLSLDTFNKVTGSGSLKFDLSAGGATGYIENSTMNQIDLTNFDNVGALFLWVYLPSTTDITNVILRWGNDSSNYFSVTTTNASDNTSFKTGWNLLRFDWAGATETGTVDVTTIDYIRVTVTKTSATAFQNIRVDSLICSLGQIYEIVYYSNYLFRNTSGTWLEKPTDDSDIVNLGVTSYNILLYEIAYLIAQELQAESSSFDLAFFEKEKTNAWATYAGNNKSQSQKPQNTYYRLNR